MAPDTDEASSTAMPEDDRVILAGVLRIGALGCLPVLLIVAAILLVTSGALAQIGPALDTFLFALGGLPLVLIIVGVFMGIAAIGSQVTRGRRT